MLTHYFLEENRHAPPAKSFQGTSESPATALRRHCWPDNKTMSSHQFLPLSSFSITILPIHTKCITPFTSLLHFRSKDFWAIVTAWIDRALFNLCSTLTHYTNTHSGKPGWLPECPRCTPITKSMSPLRDSLLFSLYITKDTYHKQGKFKIPQLARH